MTYTPIELLGADGDEPLEQGNETPTAPVNPEIIKPEEVDTEGPFIEDITANTPGLREAMGMMPGAIPGQQYIPDAAKALIEQLPLPEEAKQNLESQEAQDFMEIMRNPATMMPAVGLGQFGQDAFEYFTGVKTPDLPKYRLKAAQLIADLYSFIGPTGFLSRITRAGGTAALGQTSNFANTLSNSGLRGATPKVAKLMERLGKDKMFALFSQTGITVGSPVAVDWINELSQEGSNLSGMFRSWMPPDYRFLIPDNLAVVPGDGPEDIRRKQVMEGVYLSTLTDVLPHVIKFFKASANMKDTIKTLPEDTNAVTYQQKLDDAANREVINNDALYDMDQPLRTGDQMIDDAAEARRRSIDANLRRIEQMDEASQLADDINPSLDEPMLYRDTDQYDMGEEGALSVGPDAVRGAVRDNSEILRNMGTTHGRIRNMLSEAARIKGMEAAELTRRTLVNLVKEELVEAGKWGSRREVGEEIYELTYKQIDEDGTALSEFLMDQWAEPGFLKGILKEFTEIKNGITNLNDVGMNGVAKAIDGWTDAYFNLDTIKASALLQASTAGQIADIADGARRFDDPNVIEHAKDEILDRLEFLMVERTIGNKLRGQSLNWLNRWKRIWQKAKKDPKAYRQWLEEEADRLGMDAAANAKNTVAEVKRYFADIRHLAANRPEWVKTFMMANELTDGRVSTLTDLVNYMKDNFGVFNKMFIDMNPRTPSVINNAMMSNVYNSILSAADTVNMAGMSNSLLLLQKPLNVLYGSVRRGDWEGVRRGWYAYSAVHETLAKGLGHAAFVFRKLSEDPMQVPYVMRNDMAIKTGQTLDFAQEAGRAAIAENPQNVGVQFFADLHQNLHDMVVSPLARIGTNGMGAWDGFGRAVLANGIARYKAYDEGVQIGDFRPEVLKEARKKAHDAMRDPDGYIVDPEVDFQARELAMSLDNPIVDAVNEINRYIPALKVFTMFARTNVNILASQWNNSVFSKFAGDYQRIVGNKNYQPSEDEIKQIFKERNMEIPTGPGEMQRKFEDLQNEIKGRVGVSSLIVSSLLWKMINGQCTGDGHRDSRVQRQRGKDWPKRSCQGPDGNWYSYAGLPPGIADWIATIMNIGDNFDDLGLAYTEELFDKATFVLAASLTGQNFAHGLEPLLQFMSGDFKHLQRFAATNFNALAPGAAFRSDFGKLLSEGNKEMNNAFDESVANRNRWTEAIDPGSALPVEFDPIHGEPTGKHQGMFERIVNFVSPIKITAAITPEKEFLNDIQFDMLPYFITGSDGQEYTPDQRSRIASKMGEMKHWRDTIRLAMKEAERIGWMGEIRKARSILAKDGEGRRQIFGIPSDQLDKSKFGPIYKMLRTGMEEAKEMAEAQLEEAGEFAAARTLEETNEIRTQMGQMPIIRNK
jgi:hypothetical protein